MLAIKRVKDIMAGKKFNSMSPITHDGKIGSYSLHEVLICREGPDGRDTYATLSEMTAYQNSNQFHDHHNRLDGPSDPGGQQLYRPQYGNYPGGFPSPVHPSQMHLKYPGTFQTPDKGVPQNMGPPTITYRPDVVAVNVRNARPRGLEEPIYGTYHTLFPSQRPSGLPSLPQRPMLPLQTTPHPQRSLDDGDITPTNEMAGMYEGGGALPRPRTANKYRPVAKTRADVHKIPPQFCKKETPKAEHPTTKVPMVEKIFPASTNNTPQGTPKKLPPPPPPKRSNSVSESGTPKKEGGFPLKGVSYGYMGVKNNLQPDMAPDLPSPPPASQDRGNHQHLPEDFPPPPPPLTCLTMVTNAAKAASSVTNTSSSHCIEGTPTPAHSPESDGKGGFRPRRSECNSSFKSTSSTDSEESLPFANDNAGTIKQRASRPHPSFAIMESRSSPRSSPISSPALRRKEEIALPALRHPQPHSSLPNTLNGCQSTVKGVVNPSDAANDVLSDIGNMLAKLTDELDAMLEQDLAMKSTKIP